MAAWPTPSSAPAAPFVHELDATLPDMVENVFDGERFRAAVVVINPTPRWTPPLKLRARMWREEATESDVEPLPPLSLRKVPLAFTAGRIAAEQHFGNGAPLEVELVPAAGGAAALPLSARQFTLAIRRPLDARRVTFESAIDGSVQYYALRPAAAGTGALGQGLIVALHGASVEAINIAERYRTQAAAHIVAPTNRRPFGFNWEDWGTLDLLEALDDAQRRLAPDPARIWLKGHSMGGHGTWINGTQQINRFAAIAPIAGWSHVWSYAKATRPAEADPVQRILRRAGNVGDPFVTLPNLAQRGVFVKHPEQDESVPLAEAEAMVAALKPWHGDLQFLVRPGISHWPDHSVMEWPPLMDFLRARTRLPDREQRQFEFITADPGVAHRYAFVEVHAQQQMLAASRVRVRFEPERRTLAIDTDNVARLRLDLLPLRAEPALLGPGELTLQLDGQTLRTQLGAASRELWLERMGTGTGAGARWQLAAAPDAALKSPERGSRLHAALRNRLIVVVGTQGNERENALLLDQARYFAELMAYHGNASLRVVTDREFNGGGFDGRNVLLLGSADTNAAWAPLLAASPIQVRRGQATIGPRQLRADDLAVAFVHPRPGDPKAAVVVLAASGDTGTRVLQRVPMRPATAGVPDWLVLDGQSFDRGLDGVLGAGFFDNRWRYDEGQSGWRAAR